MGEAFKPGVIPQLFFTCSVKEALSLVSKAKGALVSHVLLLHDGAELKALDLSFRVTRAPVVQPALLVKLPVFHETISIGIQAGGTWILCPDPSLAQTIVVSYAMTTLSQGLALADALSALSSHTDLALTDDHREVLNLWDSMGATIDIKSSSWAAYQASHNVGPEDLMLALMAQTSKKAIRFQSPVGRASSGSDIANARISAEASLAALSEQWIRRLYLIQHHRTHDLCREQPSTDFPALSGHRVLGLRVLWVWKEAVWRREHHRTWFCSHIYGS